MPPVDKPTCEGAWWWEHASMPVSVMRQRAFRNKLMVYVGHIVSKVDPDLVIEHGWTSPANLPGRWIGPIRKPSFEEPAKIDKTTRHCDFCGVPILAASVVTPLGTFHEHCHRIVERNLSLIRDK